MEHGLSFARLDAEGADRLQPLRRALGVSSFGLNLLVLEPGQRGRIHRHERQEEVYLVLEGRPTLLAEGEAHVLGPEQLVRVAPELRRQLVNRGDARCVVVAIGGATPHEGRDGLAYRSWDDEQPAPPHEVPLPEDLPPAERG